MQRNGGARLSRHGKAGRRTCCWRRRIRRLVWKLRTRTTDPAAIDSAQRNDAKRRPQDTVEAALREVESGSREQARAEAYAALKLAPTRDVRATAALALASAGDTARAEKLAAELEKTFPLDTLVQRYWLPTIRAGSPCSARIRIGQSNS